MSTNLLRKAATILRERASSVRRPYGQQELVDVALADWLDASSGIRHKQGLSGCKNCTLTRPNGDGACDACIAEDLARLIVGEQP